MGKIISGCMVLMLAAAPVYAAQEPAAGDTATPAAVSTAAAAADTRTNVEKLNDPNPIVRRNALIMLGAEKKNENVPAFIKLLDDPSTEVQRAAVNALGASGDKRAAAPLMKKISGEKNVNVKMNCIIALGDLKNPSAMPLLRNLLKDPYPVYRSEALRALGKMAAPENNEAIVAMLGDEAEGVRVMAADVVAQLKLRAAAPLLVTNLKDPVAVVRRSCVVALGVVGTAAQVPDLQALSADKDPSVAAAAKEAIAQIEKRAAQPPAPAAKPAGKAPARQQRAK